MSLTGSHGWTFLSPVGAAALGGCRTAELWGLAVKDGLIAGNLKGYTFCQSVYTQWWGFYPHFHCYRQNSSYNHAFPIWMSGTLSNSEPRQILSLLPWFYQVNTGNMCSIQLIFSNVFELQLEEPITQGSWVGHAAYSYLLTISCLFYLWLNL